MATETLGSHHCYDCETTTVQTYQRFGNALHLICTHCGARQLLEIRRIAPKTDDA